MGLFDKRRPQEEQETVQADWQADRARVASFLYRARTFNGTGPEDPTLTVKLKPGERALLVATGTFLVEPRRVPARWSGQKGGFTFRVSPLAGHLGGNTPDLAPVDAGDLTFTDHRIVFSGTHKSVEWEYAELLGLCHLDQPPWTAVAVSGRERASGFRYDEGQAEEVRFAIVLGLARFNEGVESLLSDLQEQLDEIDRAHTTAPAQVPGAAQGPGAAQMPAQVPGAVQMPPAQVPGAAQTPAQAWPPPNPFSAAPAGTPAGAAGYSGTGTASSVPKPSSSYMPDDSATVIDGVPPASPGQQMQPDVSGGGTDHPGTGHPGGDVAAGTAQPSASASAGAGGLVHPPSPGPGEMGSRALNEDVTTEPKPAEDTGDPTGQIPAVTPTPTATYPAVRQQPATPLQPVQHPQQQQQAQPVHQGAPSTPPGWYPDPWRVARVRWWDGYSWTSYTSH
jgi:hypothetical protein